MSDKLNQVISIHTPRPRYKVIDPIAKRFSPRWYNGEKIKPEDIKIIFEAARWTPSGYNAQPWFFYFIAKDSSKYPGVLAALSSNNQKWAVSAPALIVATYEKEDKKGINPFANYDLGAAVLSLVLQATDLGYFARQMGNIDADKLSEALKLPKTQTPFVVIAIGRISDYQNIDEKMWELENEPRPRKGNIYKIVK